ILIAPPDGSIKARALLLIGLGDEVSLALDKMERVGKVAVREAARLAVKKVAFAPLIRDRGNSKFGAGDNAAAVIRGVCLAYDTEQRVQEEGRAKVYTRYEWWQEAGSTYFDETADAAKKGRQGCRDWHRGQAISALHRGQALARAGRSGPDRNAARVD